MNQLAFSVNVIFHKIGFPQVPKYIQYTIAGSIFSIPVVLMMYVICCMKDEVYQVPIKKPAFSPVGTQVTQSQVGAKPNSAKTREKIE